MKFRKIMQLWITGLMFFASVSAYAADQDILTISPPQGGGPGIYKVTVSGDRDSDTAKIFDYSYSVATIAAAYGGIDVNFYLTIIKGNSPGKSTYQADFGIFLPIGTYGFNLWIRDDSGQDYRRINIAPAGSNYLSLYVTEPPVVSVSLQNATAEINGTDSFTLRNLAAETTDSQGVNQKFNTWGKFQWNPNSLSWTLKDAGLEK